MEDLFQKKKKPMEDWILTLSYSICGSCKKITSFIHDLVVDT
jgi:hypothetical protein